MHRLLVRQLKKLKSNGNEINESDPKWQTFINDIDLAYKAFDEDRKIVEHSMNLSSEELLDANREMRKQNKEIEAIYYIAMTNPVTNQDKIQDNINYIMYSIDNQGLVGAQTAIQC